jgi:L-threonylcarbamoyladenylate synthase
MPDTDSSMVTKDVERVVACIKAGGLAVVPTETVYGLAADAEQPAAVARLFEVKGRPTTHPLIVHIGSIERLDEWVVTVPPGAGVLAETCWPGPLTLLLPRSRRVGDVVTGGRDTVGIRVPAHPATLDVLTRTRGGLAAPSANRYGAVSPTTVHHVLDELADHLDPETDVILDGGPSPVGVESTIVDCTVDPPQILRPGGIPSETIAELIGAPLAPASGPSRAAGMMSSHYAPRARIHLVDQPGDAEAAVARLGPRGIDIRVIDGTDDLVRYARTLYAELRDADADGCTDIIAVLPPPIGLGHAIRDRLQKAAAHR